MFARNGTFFWKKQLLLLLVLVVVAGGFPAAFAPQVVKAAEPAPGGVEGAALWLKASVGVAIGADDKVTTWTDQTTGKKFTTDETRNGITRDMSLANFNPTINFAGNGKMVGDEYTRMKVQEIFGIAKHNTIGTALFSTVPEPPPAPAQQTQMFFGEDGNQTLSIYTSENPTQVEPNYQLNGPRDRFSDNLRLLAASPQTQTAWENGVTKGKNGSFTDKLGTRTLKLGENSKGGHPLNGHFPELIVFDENKTLTEDEINRINSYLALKYGVTLKADNGNATDYVASDGTTNMWTVEKNDGYGNRITGIGRDDASALKQKQSKSADVDANVTIALDDIAASNAENSASDEFTADKTFFTFSDNAGPKEFTTEIANSGLPTGLKYTNDSTKSAKIMGRVYKVEKSDDWVDQQIVLQVDGANDVDYTIYLFINDTDANFPTAATKVFSTTNGKATLNSADLANGSYFTFVKYVDKKELETEVIGAANLQQGDYTAESWAPFVQALGEAEAILKDADKNKSEVTAALNKLTQARAGLKAPQVIPTDPAITTSAGKTMYGKTAVPVDANVKLDATVLTGYENDLTGATVVIDNFVAGDMLAFTDTDKIEGTYNSANGVLTLKNKGAVPATIEDYEKALQSVTFSTTSTDTTDRQISFTLGSAVAFEGHFYEYSNKGASITWHAAKAEAENKSYFGRKGYLVTITSREENEFVKEKTQGLGWLGAADIERLDYNNPGANEPVKNGDWRWVTGPEGLEDGGKGQQFYKGYVVVVNGSPVNGSPVNGRYNNWQTGEPNNYNNAGEYVAHIYGPGDTAGQWNDYAPTNAGVQGYIIEYGGMPGDAKFSLSAKKVIRFAAPELESIVLTGNKQLTLSFDKTVKVENANGLTITVDGVQVTLTDNDVKVDPGNSKNILVSLPDDVTGKKVTVSYSGNGSLKGTNDEPVAAFSNRDAEDPFTSALKITAPSVETVAVPKPEIAGEVEAGSTVSVVIRDKDGNEVTGAGGEATVDPNGNWKFVPNVDLANGTYTIEVKAKKGGLTATKTKPITVVDKSKLQAKVTDAKTLNEADYTPETWAALQTALTAGQAVLDKPDATPEEVAKALAELTAKIAALRAPAPTSVTLTQTVGGSNQITLNFDQEVALTDLSGFTITVGDTVVNINDITFDSTNPKKLILTLPTGTEVTDKKVTVKYDGTGNLTGKHATPVTSFTKEAENPFAAALEISKPSQQTVTELKPEIAGKAEAGSTVQVVIKKRGTNEVVADSGIMLATDGTWSFTPDKNLALGDYIIEVTATKGGQKAVKTKDLKVTTKTPPIPSVDKTTLQAKVDQIHSENLVSNDYTSESWAELEKALQQADAVLKDPTATQAEVDVALSVLKKAYDGLEKVSSVVDKSKLKAKVDEIAAENLSAEKYTEASWQALQDALEKASKVLADPKATQAEVDKALAELKKARQNLKEATTPVDKTKLQAKVDEIDGENLVAEDYTKASWQALQDALEQANKVLADPKATQAEVDKALAALKKARQGLIDVNNPVDKSKLYDKVDQIDDENLNEDDYTAASWKALQKALEKAREVLADPKATQDEVDAVLAALKKARQELTHIDKDVDKSKLQNKVDQIKDENLDEDDYTSSSWKALQKALEKAKDVLADPKATQAEVDKALADLKEARSNLRKTGSSGSGGGSKSRDRDENQTSGHIFGNNSNSTGSNSGTGSSGNGNSGGEHKKGYMNGYPDGKFRPDKGVTRAEMASILVNIGAVKSKSQNGGGFLDVPNSFWAANAIEQVRNAGLMNGYLDGNFKPNGNITRGEMAAIIFNYLKLSDDGALAGFSDVTEQYWASGIIAAVNKAGIMAGYPDGTFQPQKVLTRAEAVTILNRLFNLKPQSNITQQRWPDVSRSHWAFSDIEEASIRFFSDQP